MAWMYFKASGRVFRNKLPIVRSRKKKVFEVREDSFDSFLHLKVQRKKDYIMTKMTKLKE